MDIGIDRRATVDGEKDLKFSVLVRALDNHTHGELTRADKQQVSSVLARAADEIEKMLGSRESTRRCGKRAPLDAPYICDQPLGHAGPCGQERPGRKGVCW